MSSIVVTNVYNIYETLGSGGFGTVYKAQKPGRDRYYAIKEILLNKTSNAEQELHIQVNLPEHENVVFLVDFHLTESIMYLVLDYCNKGTLSNFILENDATGHLDEFIQDMIQGLKHLHSHNIIHTDIKPVNILVHFRVNRPVCKLSDFGTARSCDDSGESCYITRTLCGTRYFMAPELLINLCMKASYIFSLGVVFYAIQATEREQIAGNLIATVNGSTPFTEASSTAINQRVISGIRERSVANIILSMLHTNYRDRVDVYDLETNYKRQHSSSCAHLFPTSQQLCSSILCCCVSWLIVQGFLWVTSILFNALIVLEVFTTEPRCLLFLLLGVMLFVMIVRDNASKVACDNTIKTTTKNNTSTTFDK